MSVSDGSLKRPEHPNTANATSGYAIRREERYQKRSSRNKGVLRYLKPPVQRCAKYTLEPTLKKAA